MKLLLDTHLLVWAAAEPGKIPAQARRLINDVDNELLFSAVSVWEVAIKRGVERADFRPDVRLFRRNLLDSGYGELPLVSSHVLSLEALPKIHKDPFDRLLVAQAIAEGITLLTADARVGRYPGPIRRV